MLKLKMKCENFWLGCWQSELLDLLPSTQECCSGTNKYTIRSSGISITASAEGTEFDERKQAVGGRSSSNVIEWDTCNSQDWLSHVQQFWIQFLLEACVHLFVRPSILEADRDQQPQNPLHLMHLASAIAAAHNSIIISNCYQQQIDYRYPLDR